MNNQHMPHNQMPVNKPSVNGLGIAGMVIGIISVLLSYTYIGLVFGVIGLALSISGLIPKNTKYGMAIAGTALNSVAMVLFFFIVICAPPKSDIEIKASSINTEINTSDTIPNYENDSELADEYKAGSIIETNNSIITFLSCGDYEVNEEYLLPKEGYKYVTAEFEFENTGSTDMMVSSYDFDCYADGYAVDHAYVADDNELSATISSGRKAKGSVNFEVPEDAEEIVLEYSQNLFSSKKIKFIVE